MTRKESEARIEAILNDPCTRLWVSAALRSALMRDPIDAATDSEFVAVVLSEHAIACLSDSAREDEAESTISVVKG